jgi:hypothetical protein
MFFWFFLIIILFIVIGHFSKANKKDNVQARMSKIEKLRKCPVCAERVQIEAKKCRYCNEILLEVTTEEMKQIEQDYTSLIESVDPEQFKYKEESTRKSKNKNDWENKT